MSNQLTTSKPGTQAPSVREGLLFKMVCISTLAALTISIIITVVELSLEIKAERNDIKQSIYQIMHTVSGPAADAVDAIDIDKASIIVDGLFNFSAINYVKIDTDIGVTLVEKSTITATEDIKPMTLFLFGDLSNHNHRMALTVPNRLKAVGNLYVRLNLNALADKFIAGFWSDLFYIIIGVTTFVSMAGILFYYLLTKPLIVASEELGAWLNDTDADIKLSVPDFHRNDELGKLLHSVKSVIAARKKLDVDLNNQLRALDEHAIVSITDVSGKIISVNKKFIQISGYTRKELLGNTHRMIKSDEHSQEFYKNLWKTISSGKPWTGEVKNLKKNLEPYWVKATIYPFLDETGTITQYIGMRTDITKMKEKSAQIQQFKSTLDSMKDEVYMFWPDTLQIFYANEAAITSAGITQKELYKLTPIDMSTGYEQQFLLDQFERLLNGENAEFRYQSLHYNHGGTAIPVETLIALIRPKGEKPRFVAITNDISAQLEVERTKTEFVSTVSHELRTPLTSIIGGLGLVRTGALGDISEKAKKVLDIAYQNSERLKKLINDILDIEKAEAGMLNIVVESLDISELIDDVIEANKGYGDEHSVTFVALDNNDPVYVHGDSERLIQVMSNLMSNAAKFSHKGGVIEISLTQSKNRVQVSVTDFGSGIPVAAQPSIFEKFTQADSSDQRQKGGTGLGLSIAKSLVQAMGGSIGFTSNVGKGTTFFFDLKASSVKKEKRAV
ncbi:MAG: PAS domain S-box protein [Amylibacter sp.]|nr:PAS domain S-box protein [Amylibacter sp.]